MVKPSRGGVKRASGGGFSAQARENVKDTTGFKVTTKDGTQMEYFIQERNGQTYYSNNLGEIPEPTPNNMTKAQMLTAIKNNGGKVETYSKSKLVKMEEKRLKDREDTNTFLNLDNVRNKGGDVTNKAYRNFRKAQRLAKRR